MLNQNSSTRKKVWHFKWVKTRISEKKVKMDDSFLLFHLEVWLYRCIFQSKKKKKRQGFLESPTHVLLCSCEIVIISISQRKILKIQIFSNLLMVTTITLKFKVRSLDTSPVPSRAPRYFCFQEKALIKGLSTNILVSYYQISFRPVTFAVLKQELQ